MVRLKDIAKLAGVSVMTVSKALRDEPDVSAATKARIKALAQQMGYVPDSSAQGLRTKTTKLFGLVIPATTNPIYARIVFAIEEHAYELGYDVLLAQTLNKAEREDVCLRRLLSRRVDGLFITPVYRFEAEARIYQEIVARKIPTVLLGPPAPFCKNFVSMEIEEVVASFSITKHLIQLGHKKIAYLTGPPAAPWAHERFEGYRRALREAGLEADDKLVFAAGSTLEDGTKAALQMLDEGCQFTAVQAVSDLVAIGCAETLLQQGLKIPGDISLAGYGNILAAEFYRVPLTTVSQPKYRLGVAAVEMMMNLIRGEKTFSRRLPAELVLRQSTAAPKPASR
jgi:DNA-binding LacI/PurR family transcriptional regulator